MFYNKGVALQVFNPRAKAELLLRVEVEASFHQKRKEKKKKEKEKKGGRSFMVIIDDTFL